MHVIAAKAVAFKEALMPEFKEYQRQIVKNARALAKRLTEDGFRIVSDGTDNHMMLVDLTPKGITGNDAETALDAAGITVNKNSIPYDEKPPRVTSGIRLGTPIVTTRGMREPEMKVVGDLICEALANISSPQALASLRERTKTFCSKFRCSRWKRRGCKNLLNAKCRMKNANCRGKKRGSLLFILHFALCTLHS